ncbi:MAG: transcriptional regulator [Rhodobacterales bacterium 17-64-5]|nr:MAG: transcriptional regulator [Rhodobacterales bacterium 17-64-5]
MRLTTRTNFAIRVLMYCGVNEGSLTRSSDIAVACNASGNHLAQVIHQLHVNGFVTTTRGRSGGVRLRLAPKEISIGRVFRLFEANSPFTECFSAADNTCPLTQACRLRGVLARSIEAFYHELDQVTLDDLVRDNCALQALLTMAEAPRQLCAGA